MESKRLETKVGLFIFIGLALLALLLIQFSKGSSFFHGTYELRLHAASVGGIKPRAGVLLAGVQVGSVSNIQLANDGKSVTIILKIQKNFKIYHDAQFAIEQSGFLGDQYISIIPTTNTPPVLQNGANVFCEQPFDFQQVARSATGFIQRIDSTAKKLDASVSELQREVLNEQTLTNFSAAIANLRVFSQQALTTVGDINGIIATNTAEADAAVSNAVAFSEDLKRLANSANALLTTNGAVISVAVKNVESSTETLKQLMADLQSGKGLAGTMLQNQELATNVQLIANNLAITTSNLNRAGLWGILWSHKPKKHDDPPENSDRRNHSTR
ncbi:MAG TPA: MlaD family protein [Verrucomicrobiae bacterium]